jgi:hypothetical protein
MRLFRQPLTSRYPTGAKPGPVSYMLDSPRRIICREVASEDSAVALEELKLYLSLHRRTFHEHSLSRGHQQ